MRKSRSFVVLGKEEELNVGRVACLFPSTNRMIGLRTYGRSFVRPFKAGKKEKAWFPTCMYVYMCSSGVAKDNRTVCFPAPVLIGSRSRSSPWVTWNLSPLSTQQSRTDSSKQTAVQYYSSSTSILGWLTSPSAAADAAAVAKATAEQSVTSRCHVL